MYIRDGFRSRLDTIVHGQASRNSDTSSSDPESDFSHNLAEHDIPVEVQLWNSEQLQSSIQVNGVNDFTNNTINVAVNVSADVITREEEAIQRRNGPEQVTANERINLPQLNFAELDPWRENTQANMVNDWQEISGNTRQRRAHGNHEEGPSLPSQPTWPGNSSRSTLGNWARGPANISRNRRSIPIRRASRFQPPDDDNVYSMELRELLGRYVVPLVYMLD